MKRCKEVLLAWAVKQGIRFWGDTYARRRLPRVHIRKIGCENLQKVRTEAKGRIVRVRVTIEEV